MRTDIMQLRSVGACGRVSSHTPEYIDEGLVENGAEAVPREVSSFSSSVQRDSSTGIKQTSSLHFSFLASR